MLRIALLLTVCLATTPLGAESCDEFAPDQGALPVAAPEGAIQLLDMQGHHNFVDSSGNETNWPVINSALESTSGSGQGNSNHTVSQALFQDADIHVEFLLPETGSGNSGIYIHGYYELQILNSHEEETPGITDSGAVYNISPPLVNAARGPGIWQVYDIRYQAPRRDEKGQIQIEGSITAWLNGEKVQESTAIREPVSQFHPFLYGTTSYLDAIEEEMLISGRGPLFLQDHGNPVQFRNIWFIDRTPLDGDVNGDGHVGSLDFNTISSNFLLADTERCEGDLTGDSVVDFADFREWKNATQVNAFLSDQSTLSDPTGANSRLSGKEIFSEDVTQADPSARVPETSGTGLMIVLWASVLRSVQFPTTFLPISNPR